MKMRFLLLLAGKRVFAPLCDITEGLKTDREVFADAFSTLADGIKRSAKEFINETLADKSQEERRQFLFCFEVFKELGFFTVQRGLLLRNYSVKKPLDDSVLYRSVRERQC